MSFSDNRCKEARAARRARKLNSRRPRLTGAERYSRRPSVRGKVQ